MPCAVPKNGIMRNAQISGRILSILIDSGDLPHESIVFQVKEREI